MLEQEKQLNIVSKEYIHRVTWSGIRAKLEKEYLADSLKGRIQYFATSYSKNHDHEGRAAIMLDGKEIISGGYYTFDEFDNQSIEKSLQSDNMLVRIMSILDRRVGKRKLAIIKETVAEQEPIFREFFAIRAEAEGII